MRFDNLHNHHLLTSPYKAACSATFVGKFRLVAAISRTKTLAMFSGCNKETTKYHYNCRNAKVCHESGAQL